MAKMIYDNSIIPSFDRWSDLSGESVGTGKPLKSFVRQLNDMEVVYSIYRSELTLKWHYQVKLDKHKVTRSLRGFDTDIEAYNALMKKCGFAKEVVDSVE